MSRKLPPLNSLRAFEAAGRLGSFTAAADELFVTHGAISRHVQQLEAWLGHALFERYNRRVALTDAGRAYLGEIGASFDRIALVTGEQLQKGRQRVLRVNAPATFSLRWLVPRLSTFQLANPAIEVRLATSNEPLERIRDAADLVIRGGPHALDGYDAEEFLSEVRLPVCAPRVLEAKALRSVKDLKQHTLLHAATYPGMWPEWLAAAGQPRLAPRNSLTFEHFYLTLQAALDGLGIAMGPTALVADDVAEGRLVFPFDGPEMPAWRYFSYVAHVGNVTKARADDHAVTAFRAWLATAGAQSASAGRPATSMLNE